MRLILKLTTVIVTEGILRERLTYVALTVQKAFKHLFLNV